MNKEKLIRSLKKEKFSEKIITAFEKVQREDFVPKEFKQRSYLNEPLPIGLGQTISQPYTIAFMLTLLGLKDNIKILEVGSGSGYVLALINEISKNSEIYGIEIVRQLADKSKNVLEKNRNISITFGNGIKGLKEKAPFDRILVSASYKDIPQKLVNQLNYGGILVCVVNDSIVVVEKHYGENKIREYPGFVFVELVED